MRSPNRRLKIMALSTALCGLMLPSMTGQAATQKTSTVQAISAKDKQQGAEAHPQLVAEFGGAMTGAQASYVESVGKTVSVQSGLSNARDDFTVTLLNSPINNAFAIPGGYVYVTRELVGLMDSEAELAAVLGHEVGHVAARHAAKRQSAATQNQVIAVLGSVLSGVLLGNSAAGQIGQQIFSQGSQLLTLRYSRKQETEADNLGVAYLQRAGYDPRAMSTVLQSLAEQNALDARLMGSTTSVPEWASTHPDPASRVRTALARAGANAKGRENRDVFLNGINGLMYGDDPKQGVVDGRKFTHPELRMAFEAPQGFYLVNGTRAVSIGGQGGKAQMTTGAYNGNLDDYVSAVFAQLAKDSNASISPGAISRTTVNGIPAAWSRTLANNGQTEVTVFAYEWNKGSAFHFLTITQAGAGDTFGGMFNSMRRINDSEAKAIKPRKLVVVTAKAGDTVETLAKRMAYADAPLDRFLVLNGLKASSKIAAGQRVKIVTY